MHYIPNKFMHRGSHFSNTVIDDMCSVFTERLLFSHIQSHSQKCTQMQRIVNEFEGIECDKDPYHAHVPKLVSS